MSDDSSNDNLPNGAGAPPPAKPTPVRMTLWALLFAGMMLMFAMLTLLALVYPRPRTLEESEAARRRALLGNQKERQLARLNSYGWIDESRHLAHIPVEEAMQQMVDAPSASAQKPNPQSTP